MCYTVLLSTTTSVDLVQYNTEFIRFSTALLSNEATETLNYQHKWHVDSKSGCGCAFRHLHSVELGFGVPVDWYPEEADEITATLQFIRIIRELVATNNSVDCIDIWEGQEKKSLLEKELRVDLSLIFDEEFRFFENHHFIFYSSTEQGQ